MISFLINAIKIVFILGFLVFIHEGGHFLIAKLCGASKIWQNNQYYVELVYILSGMQDFKDDEHDRVKYLVHHCTKLINNMIEEIISNES